MTKMAIFLATASAFWSVPASAQLDAMSWGDASASLGQTQVMSEVINEQARSGGRTSAVSSKQRAQATCAQRDSLKAKHGANDPRIQQLYKLCAKQGY
ncbi:MAG: hypothetical protein KJ585_12150 [Alphaproteobacteria bacterium]|jgi:hypothetical protein|uniref:hypothetical protein n=1 Tax=Sphingobium TaxID=165695 RepID=UPI003137782B|nr:hypothetical protein [Alphaproteobacteria bacterium]